MEMKVLPKDTDISGIRKEVFRECGEFRILGMDFWKRFTDDQIKMFMLREAIYVLPTEELVDFLDKLIGDTYAIEVGAGRGFIGRELNIRTTDSYQQQDDIRSTIIYRMTRQTPVRYPKYVEKLDAVRAVRKYHPHTVLGCFVTHRWREDTQDGNDLGIDMKKMYSMIRRFILVGNKKIHRNNPLMSLPHEEIQLDGLITRGFDNDLNRIFIWEK